MYFEGRHIKINTYVSLTVYISVLSMRLVVVLQYILLPFVVKSVNVKLWLWTVDNMIQSDSTI